MQETWVWSWGQEYPLDKGMGLPIPGFLPGEFHGKEAWRATVHRVAKSQTLLSEILHPENVKESTKHLLQPINKFSKVIGHKINTQKSAVFLVTCNKWSKKTEKTIPFMIASKKNQILKNKFNPKGERLMHWNYKCNWKKLKCYSVMFDSSTPRNGAHQAPPSMGFPRQEYWSRLSFPSPGDLPDRGIGLRSPELQADSLTSEPPGKPSPGKKLEKTQTSGNIPHVHGLTWRHRYCPKW